MGHGSYDTNTRSVYQAKVATKTRDQIFTNDFKTREVFKKNSKMSPHNLGTREARDSEEHPESIPVIIALDCTGSMGRTPEKIIKDDLNTIMDTIRESGVDHTQIMFMAIGDHAMGDPSPLQVGQFESSDELMQKWLEEIDIRGCRGGGNSVESYHLAWLVAGYHISTDHFEKRGKKGYLFTIGDEGHYEEDTVKAIQNLVGTPGEIWKVKDILKKAQETFHVYHIHTDDAAYPSDGWGKRVADQWRETLGENFHIVKDYHGIAPKIGTIVAQGESLSTVTGTSVTSVENAQNDPTSENIML